jgi:hypothetical protein
VTIDLDHALLTRIAQQALDAPEATLLDHRRFRSTTMPTFPVGPSRRSPAMPPSEDGGHRGRPS